MEENNVRTAVSRLATSEGEAGLEYYALEPRAGQGFLAPVHVLKAGSTIILRAIVCIPIMLSKHKIQWW